MKRPFLRFEVLCLAAALSGGAGCNPDHSVKPGAPVLTEVAIVEGGGATVTSIPAGEAACVAGTVAGGVCDPATATTCFLATAKNWCRCMATPMAMTPTPAPTCTDGGMAGAAGGAAGGAGGVTGLGGLGGVIGTVGAAGGAAGASGADAGADAAGGAGGAATPPAGTWDCDPFSPTAQVLFLFDRLLDTKPLDPGDAGAAVAAATITSGVTPIMSNADYTPNGTPGQIIFPAFGDFRADGPNLLVSGVPALPGSAAVTVALDPTKVLAKDGKTPFDGTKFAAGSLTFSTVGFSASITAPAAPPPTDPCAPPVTTAPLDATGTITFNSPVDLTALMAAVTVKSGATAVPFTLTTMDNLTFTIAPGGTDMMWPASSNIVIAVPDTVADEAGDTLGAGNGPSAPFTTGAQ